MKAAVVYKTDGIIEKVKDVLNQIGVSYTLFTQPTPDLEGYDFIVSIGGDGTILRILQKLRHCPPIFGINMGRVGLLTHSNPENFQERLKKAVEEFEIEIFPRLKCNVDGREILALNEIAVVSKQPAKLIHVEIRVDDILADRIRCDGIIISTQIGSTGYAFSAGGPVVDPYLDCITIVPLAPFRYGWKPFIVNIERKIEVEADNPLVIADGQTSAEPKDTVRVEKSEFPAVFFKNDERFRELFIKVKNIC